MPHVAIWELLGPYIWYTKYVPFTYTDPLGTRGSKYPTTRCGPRIKLESEPVACTSPIPVAIAHVPIVLGSRAVILGS